MGTAILAALIFLAAALYSSVGHAGASGYLAILALWGLDPLAMKPVALTLNVLVAGIATIRFARAGGFSWPLFWPFGLASVPLAFVGGAIQLPAPVYRPVVALALLYAAYRLWPVDSPPSEFRRPHLGTALLAGAGIGLLSGLTGVGGGIFLGPLLLVSGWADSRRAAGVTAAFNLVNSIAGLAGMAFDFPALPAGTRYWAVAAGLGGWVGSGYGSRRLGNKGLRRVLALILIVASVRMLWPG